MRERVKGQKLNVKSDDKGGVGIVKGQGQSVVIWIAREITEFYFTIDAFMLQIHRTR